MIKKLLILLLLLPIASASSAYRTFTYNSTTYDNPEFTISGLSRNLEVTLTINPLSDFDIPGYYVQEYIPNNLTFKSTNADWYTYDHNTLTMLKLLPTSSSLTYTLEVPSSNSDLLFYGIYKDENRNQYSIPQNRILYKLRPEPIEDTTTKFLKPSPTPTPTPFQITILNIETSPPTSIVEIKNTPPDNTISFLLLLIIIVIPLLYLKTRSPTSILIQEIPFIITKNKLFIDNVEHADTFRINVTNNSEKALKLNIKVPESVFILSNNNDIMLSHTSLTTIVTLKNKADMTGVIIITKS